ncbi:DUF2924 domain-containing protein [Pseudomonadota bacterium]
MAQRNRNAPASSLAAINSAGRQELARLFEAEFGREPAARSSLDFLRRNLAWAKQSIELGHTPRKQRQQIIRRLERALSGSKQYRHQYRAGTRLVREWQGKVYEVTILDQGYAWEGRVYPNLTRIATEITGTKWSGPRFFGLTRSSNDQS